MESTCFIYVCAYLNIRQEFINSFDINSTINVELNAVSEAL